MLNSTFKHLEAYAITMSAHYANTMPRTTDRGGSKKPFSGHKLPNTILYNTHTLYHTLPSINKYLPILNRVPARKIKNSPWNLFTYFQVLTSPALQETNLNTQNHINNHRSLR